ncbi:MAG: hypothetical protein MUO72_08770 [Bacteroidales bacterium]|nr:hypothetical protein [Bacteroidales bacterium]
MKWLICNILIVTFISVLSVKGQAYDQNVSSILETLYNRINKSKDDTERLRINDSIILIIDSYSLSDSVIDHRFNNLRFLGQITSPDKRVKIITWNLILLDGTNRYFCYLIRDEGTGKQNKVFRLTAIIRPETIRTDILYSRNDWYGALYYDIRPFKTNKQTYYILLGIDYYNLYMARKIIEVLSFTPEGEIIFGKNCFVNGDKVRSREVLEYSSDGVVSLRFNSGNSVVFDHLVSFSSDNKNNREFFGAEYSYDAYILKKGMWRFVSNYDIKNKK